MTRLIESFACARNSRVGRTALMALASALAFAASTATAQQAEAYPQRQIRMVVGFPPGTGPDVVARVVAGKLQETLRQTIVVDNRAGAGGQIAAAEVARAPADGYTIYLGTVGEMSIASATYAKLPYSPLKDFAPIAQVASTDFVLVAPASVPSNNLKDYVEWAKAQKQFFMATFGAGTPGHFAAANLGESAGLRFEAIHYKATGDAITGIINGDAQGLFATPAVIAPHVNSGKLKALATTGKARTPLLPNVPTAAEQGYPTLWIDGWFGLFAPAGVPAPILDRLNAAVLTALQDGGVKEKLGTAGIVAAGTQRAAFAEAHSKDVARWTLAVQKMGFKLNE
jgi:tripartite-type tricarboxylate transporter receptor subunit TctC